MIGLVNNLHEKEFFIVFVSQVSLNCCFCKTERYGIWKQSVEYLLDSFKVSDQIFWRLIQNFEFTRNFLIWCLFHVNAWNMDKEILNKENTFVKCKLWVEGTPNVTHVENVFVNFVCKVLEILDKKHSWFHVKSLIMYFVWNFDNFFEKLLHFFLNTVEGFFESWVFFFLFVELVICCNVLKKQKHTLLVFKDELLFFNDDDSFLVAL